jgi:hypothetical protein
MERDIEAARWYSYWRPRIDGSAHPFLTNRVVDLLEEVLQPAHAFNPASVRRYLFMVQDMLERGPERPYHRALREHERVRAAQRARETDPARQG